jgi:hypothetical protein
MSTRRPPGAENRYEVSAVPGVVRALAMPAWVEGS